MALSKRQLQLIHDNPKLSSSSLAKFLGVNIKTVSANRDKPTWKHDGRTIPFLSTVNHDGLRWYVQYGKRKIHRGSFNSAMDNVDRLIYCLENNNGKLPRTLNDVVLGDLEFIK